MAKPNTTYATILGAALLAACLPLAARAQSETILSQYVPKQALAQGFAMQTPAGDARAAVAPDTITHGAFAELIAPEYYPALPLDKSLVSRVYHYALLPASGNKLSAGITLEFSYPETEARFKEIYLYNQELGKWRHLAGTIDPLMRTVAASTDWASGFIAVFADHLDQGEYLKEKLGAPSILVADAKTGEVLLERASGVKRPIASLTKLMTATEFLEHNPGWDSRVAMVASDDTIPAKIYARAGDVFTARDLFYATLLKSANNAARALARSTGLSSGEFVAGMNEKAKALDMQDTSFSEPTGLSAENVSTAQDLYALSRHVFSDILFLKATTPKALTIAAVNSGKRHVLENTNKAIDVPYVVIGSKTGYTVEAGRNVIMKARNKAGREVIAITLGGASPGGQWDDMRLLLDAALGNL
ncbi:MAG: D-alanyl-D-alanine carboxypeptidase [Parcubacteria group bacterium]|nr:D-alanyl-D-alanine carboxypeptidase [Parcubacteria group bacterium]